MVQLEVNQSWDLKINNSQGIRVQDLYLKT